MAAQKEMNERAKKLQERSHQLAKDKVKLAVDRLQFEIDGSKWAIEKLRTSTEADIAIESFALIKCAFFNGVGEVIYEDVDLDCDNRKDRLTKKDISRLEDKLAFLLRKKYNEASDEDKEKQILEIPSKLKGRLIPLFVRRYNALSPEDKKKQIDEVLDEILGELTLKEEKNLIDTVVFQLKTDIEKFKNALKTEVDTPQKNGWLKSPNPMETALELHNAVYTLLDKEIDFDEKYPVIFRFHEEARGSFLFRDPVIAALYYSISIGLLCGCVVMMIGLSIASFGFPIWFLAAEFFPILLGVSGGISLLLAISAYAIQTYHNFPLSGGDMATRGKAVHDGLKALADDMKTKPSIFGNFFQEIPVESEKNSEETLIEGKPLVQGNF